MSEFGWEYGNSWRPKVSHLWFGAIILLVLGLVAEVKLHGAFAASGGLTIAVTMPLFVFAMAKQYTYETDLRLAIINLAREENYGVGVLEKNHSIRTAEVYDQLESSRKDRQGFEASFANHRAYSRALITAQAWIVSVASFVTATGDWIGNVVFHCKGQLTC